MRTVTKVRPSTDVEFKVASKNDHIRSTYFDTKKQIHYNKTLSEDKLTLIVERTFVDRAALDEFENDPVCDVGEAAQINKDNGIKTTKEVVTLE